MGLTWEQGQKIARLYKEMYDRMCAYANGILRDKELSEELVQETFKIACDEPSKPLSSPNPQGWLMKALKNTMKNAQRKRATMAKHIVSAEDADIERIVSPDSGDNIDLMYSDLVDEAGFRLIKRVAVDRYTVLEAAEELGISEDACKKRFQRAKEKMRKNLSN